jgi:hypothetical protein
MSIAEEESTRKYYLLEGPEHGEGLREKLLDAALENRHVIAQREAYVAGRTAELTEAEIEAAAKAMYDELCGNIIHGWLDENGDPQMDEDPFRTVFINATVEALTAARKAVTE